MSDLTKPIGSAGEFVRKVEVLWIEDSNRRRLLTTDGEVLLDQHAETNGRPQQEDRWLGTHIDVERVLDFDVQRFGFKHTLEDLGACRLIVTSMGEQLGRSLRIVDTFGWSGEVALAMCIQDGTDVITIVDELSGFQRKLPPVDPEAAAQTLRENLGDRFGTRINWTAANSASLPTALDDAFDIVFIDTVADAERSKLLIERWAELLVPGGLLLGCSEYFANIAMRADGNKIHNSELFYLSKEQYELWRKPEALEVG